MKLRHGGSAAIAITMMLFGTPLSTLNGHPVWASAPMPAALRAPVERVNAWLKSFKVLTTRYRRTWKDLALTTRATFRILRYRQLTAES